MSFDVAMIIVTNSMPNNVEKLVIEVFTDPDHVAWKILKVLIENVS